MHQAVSSALAAEQPKVEGLKAQLKDLFQFPQDVQPHSDHVIAVIQQYQSVKAKAFKLRTTAESDLKRDFKKPLLEAHYWKEEAQKLLEATDSLNDLPLFQTFLPLIEASLEESSHLKEELPLLEQKKDLLHQLFNAEEAESLLADAAHAAQEMEALHTSFLQRKVLLQSSITESVDFDFILESLHGALARLRQDMTAASKKQMDLEGKERQLQRLQTIEKERLKLGHQIELCETSAQSYPSHMHKIDQLISDHQNLKRLLQAKLAMSTQGITEHHRFQKRLAELQKWLVSISHKLEDMTETLEEEASRKEAESLLTDLHGREIQVHQLEVRGRTIKENSSPAQAVDIEGKLLQLRDSWDSVKTKLESLASLLPADQLDSPFEDAMDSLNQDMMDSLNLGQSQRVQDKRPGRTGAFLQRVCCAALPLQLLLLLLLLLAFLLLPTEESHSCTLANNFARSFKLMLRYEHPPAT